MTENTQRTRKIRLVIALILILIIFLLSTIHLYLGYIAFYIQSVDIPGISSICRSIINKAPFWLIEKGMVRTFEVEAFSWLIYRDGKKAVKAFEKELVRNNLTEKQIKLLMIAIYESGQSSQYTAKIISKHLNSENNEIKLKILILLNSITPSVEVLPEIVKLLKEDESEMKVLVFTYLLKTSPESYKFHEEFLKLVDDNSPAVRRYLARLLGTFGQLAIPHTDLVLKGIQDENEDVRLEWLASLAKINPEKSLPVIRSMQNRGINASEIKLILTDAILNLASLKNLNPDLFKVGKLIELINLESFLVKIGGTQEKVGLIGLDTKEQRVYKNQDFIEYQEVHLAILRETYPAGTELLLECENTGYYKGKNKYYIWVILDENNVIFYNAMLIKMGHSKYKKETEKMKYNQLFTKCQASARAKQKGIWATEDSERIITNPIILKMLKEDREKERGDPLKQSNQ